MSQAWLEQVCTGRQRRGALSVWCRLTIECFALFSCIAILFFNARPARAENWTPPPVEATHVDVQTHEPGKIVFNASNDSAVLEVAEHGESFANEEEAISWVAGRLNGNIEYDEDGRPVGVFGESLQIGDLFYIDEATGEAVEIDDPIPALIGGKSGIITIDGQPRCAKADGCDGLVYKSPPAEKSSCDDKYCIGGESWNTKPWTRLFIYSSVGSKVTQKNGGYRKECGFCWKGPLPWRCCKGVGSNTLALINRFQVDGDESTFGNPTVRVYSFEERNVTSLKHRLYSVFSGTIKTNDEGDVRGKPTAPAKATAKGVCGSAEGRGPEGRTTTKTAAGDVGLACPDESEGISRPLSEPTPPAPPSSPPPPPPSRGWTCFAAGTTVHGPQGQRPIESIAVGDLVWSRDEASGNVEPRRVTRTFVTPNQPLVEVVVEGDNGRREKLKATSEHPFQVLNRGWVKVMNLQPGDQVIELNGKQLSVISVSSLSGAETVYNFEVEDFHTYFVGSLHAWVHNSCGEEFATQGLERGQFAGRSQ